MGKLKTNYSKNDLSFSLVHAAIIVILCLLIPIHLPAEEKELKTVVIPLNEYNRLMKELGDSVLLPLDKYREILFKIDQLQSAAEGRDAFTFQYANYKIDVVNQSAIGEAEIGLNVIKSGWLKLSSISNTIIGSADRFTLDGEKARFIGSDGYLYLFTDKIGRITFKFNFYLPVQIISDGSSNLSCRVIQGLKTESKILISDPGIEFDVKGAIVNSSIKKAGRTEIILINNDPNLNISWHKETVSGDAIKTEEAKFLASVSSLYRPGPEYKFAVHLITIQMLRGEMQEVMVDLPADYRLVDLIGDGIASFKTTGTGNKPSLQLTASKPMKDGLVFLLEMEKRENNSSISIVPPVVLNASRQNGFIAINPLEPALLMESDGTSYMKIDWRELPDELLQISGTEPTSGFKYRFVGNKPAEPLVINLVYQDVAKQLSSYIEEAKATTLLTPDGFYISRVEYKLFSAKDQFLRLKLSSMQSVLSVFLDGKPVPAVIEGSEIIIPLKGEYKKNTYRIELVILSQGEKFNEEGKFSFRLPKVELPVNIMSWNLLLPEGYEYNEFTGNFTQGKYMYIPVIDFSVMAGAGKPPGKPTSKGIQYKEKIAVAKRELEATKDESISEEIHELPSPPELIEIASPEIDISSATLSLKIRIPEEGYKKEFYSIINVDEAPALTFTYEKI